MKCVKYMDGRCVRLSNEQAKRAVDEGKANYICKTEQKQYERKSHGRKC